MADQSPTLDPQTMSDEQKQQVGQSLFRAQVQDRAIKDRAFRQALISDPKAALGQEFGVTVPDNVILRVVEDTPTSWHLVLPPAVAAVGAELSEDELEAVAGGWTHPTDCGTCWTNCNTCQNAGCFTNDIDNHFI